MFTGVSHWPGTVTVMARQFRPERVEYDVLTAHPEPMTVGQKIGCVLVALAITAYFVFLMLGCIYLAGAIGKVMGTVPR